MRGFLDHCLSLDMIKVDPLAGVTKAKMNKTNGHHPWESRSAQSSKRSFNNEIMPMLQEAIDAMPSSDHLTFLLTAQGKPFTAAGFGWRKAPRSSLQEQELAHRLTR